MEGIKGGGEVRRVHVLYFLSRDGAIEQPHLIRVHHLHRSGVHLRDVKRWLSDLRGKDMPDLFAWSYKRRYKSGYVWQDLMDDDLITPISDNEYILKGSELSSKFDSPLLDTNSSNEEEQQNPQAPDLNTYPEFLHIEIDTKTDSLKPPPESDSPPLSGSDISGDSNKRASMIKLDRKESEVEEKEDETNEACNERRSNQTNSSSTNWWSGRKKSHIFRTLFRCGGAEADDRALMRVQREERYQSISGGSYKRTTVADRFRDDK